MIIVKRAIRIWNLTQRRLSTFGAKLYGRFIYFLTHDLPGKESWLLALLLLGGLFFLLLASYRPYIGEGITGLLAEIENDPLPIIFLSLTGLFLILLALAIILRHFAHLESLRGQLLSRSLDPFDTLPLRRQSSFDSIGRFHNSVSRALLQRKEQYQKLQNDLSQVLAALAEAVVVIIPDGRVSMFNQAAVRYLGEQQLKIGYTIFGALRRSVLAEALKQLQEESVTRLEVELRTSTDLPVSAIIAQLEDRRGFVISLATGEIEAGGRLTHEWSLHEKSPQVALPDKNTHLSLLPVAVLDTETTGLNAPQEAVISFGAVRMSGSRIYTGETIQQNIFPDRPLNPQSIPIHGLTKKALAKEPPIETVWPRLHSFLKGAVLVGHNIGFDLLVLKQHLKRNGIDWQPPISIDTVLLASALEPSNPDLELEALADRYGVPVLGRHTALGDALMTANLFARLLLCFRDNGLERLGDLLKLQSSRIGLLMEQKREGWLLPG